MSQDDIETARQHLLAQLPVRRLTKMADDAHDSLEFLVARLHAAEQERRGFNELMALRSNAEAILRAELDRLREALAEIRGVMAYANETGRHPNQNEKFVLSVARSALSSTQEEKEEV